MLTHMRRQVTHSALRPLNEGPWSETSTARTDDPFRWPAAESLPPRAPLWTTVAYKDPECCLSRLTIRFLIDHPRLHPFTEDPACRQATWRPLLNSPRSTPTPTSTISWTQTPHRPSSSRWKTYRAAHRPRPHHLTTPAAHQHRLRRRPSSFRASRPRRGSHGDRNSLSPKQPSRRASEPRPTTRRSSAASSVLSATERPHTTRGNARGKRRRPWRSCSLAPTPNSKHTADSTALYPQMLSFLKCNCALTGMFQLSSHI